MNYTKGEWEAKYISGGNYQITSPDFVGVIAEVNTDCYAVKDNAKLIASAPDMYEALQKTYTHLCNGEFNNDVYVQNIKTVVEKALAKAEGNPCYTCKNCDTPICHQCKDYDKAEGNHGK